MQISKSKTAAIAIAIFLMLSMTASMMLVPTTRAATTMTILDHAYISVSTNPVGVGQSLEVIMWMNQIIFGADPLNNIRFQGYELIVTAPDGTNTTESLPVVTSDPTSALDYSFTPTTVGTYTLTFIFPGQTYTYPAQITIFGPNTAYLGAYYGPATASTTLTVQSTSIAAIPPTPLPTAYWTRPIYGENSNWYTISSNWLGLGSPGYSGIGSSPNLGANEEQFPTQDVGPLTAHIMWTKPLQSGGIVGGNNFVIQGDSYFEGSAYQQRFDNPIILDGMLYYTEPISTTEPSSGPTVCVNLQTGQQIWSSTAVPALSFGYIYDAQDPNEHGVWPPMLVATTSTGWQVYDADTGDPLFNVTNVPSGVTLLGPEGEYLVVSLVNLGPTTMTPYGPVSSGPASWYLQEWNSSRLWDDLYSGPSTTPTLPPPITNGANPSLLDFNVSVPVLNGLPSVTAVGAILGNELLCYSGNLPSTGADLFFGSLSDTPYTYYGINLNATVDTVGAKLWSNTLQPPAGNITVTEAGIDPVNNVFVEEYRETMQFVGYSLSTGDKLWGPTAGQQALDYYGSPGSGSLADAIDYGKIYSSAYGGILYCYDTKTGDLLWTYGNGGAGNSTNSGVETPFGYYPTFVNAIGSGVVYLVTTEHTIETPLFKGALARAVNATTGAQIWTLSDYTGEFVTDSFAIADGYATFFNGYDNQIYAVGQGPSATTVQAPLTAITEGSNVVIQGTVMDVSAGTQQTEQKGDFPNGVPVASDASMTAWMGYVYQQQPLPTNFTGVTVQIAAIDPNGNHVVVGTATTDANGMFHYTWTTPNVPGTYTVYATFAGTNGYYGSNAETNMIVQAASSATPAPTATPTSTANLYFLPMSIAIIIVIVIVGAVLALLMLRKRP